MNSTSEIFPVSLVVLVSFSLTVTLPSNAFVLWLILRGARLLPDIFYFNLSLEEVLVSLLLTWSLISHQFKCIPCLEPFAFFSGMFLTARPLLQFLICLECYMGVKHPVLFLRLKRLRYRLTCCIGAWLMIFASCIYNNYTYIKMVNLFTIFVHNSLILLAVIFCLLSVLRTLKRPGPGENNVKKKGNRIKTRAFKIISVTLASMTLNVLLSIGPIPAQFYMPAEAIHSVYTICGNFSQIIGSMQPLIYLRARKIICF